MRISPSRILHRDEHFLLVQKLAGELTVRGSGPVRKLPLFDLLRQQEPGIRPVNRLDFATSGIVMFARTRKALAAARACSFRKTYRALIAGSPGRQTGVIRAPLPARSGRGEVPAETHYHVLERFPGCTLVEAEIQGGGRQHQIRRHFSAIGHPLVLDNDYGDAGFNRAFARHHHYRRFFLHASSVSFRHPFTGHEVTVHAPIPRAFADMLDVLR